MASILKSFPNDGIILISHWLKSTRGIDVCAIKSDVFILANFATILDIRGEKKKNKLTKILSINVIVIIDANQPGIIFLLVINLKNGLPIKDTTNANITYTRIDLRYHILKSRRIVLITIVIVLKFLFILLYLLKKNGFLMFAFEY